MKVIDVEQCPEKNKKREDYNRRADDAVDNQDAVGGEVAPYLVDKPCKTVPPQQRSKHDAQIAHAHFKRMVGHNECQLGVTSHEKEYNKRVGECYEECCDAVVNQRALLVSADMDFLCGVALEAIDAEQEEHDASAYLKIKEIAAQVVDRGGEGIVVRDADAFAYSDFAFHVAKYVRAGHVNTDIHWSQGSIIPNELCSERNKE